MADLLPVLGWPSQALARPALEATSFDARHKVLAAGLADILRISQGKGIAAPQVGVAMRLVVMEMPGRKSKGKPQYAGFVNPKIVEQSPLEEIACEDCLSLRTVSHVFVMRPSWVAVEAWNLDGVRKVHRVEGGVAAMFCHLIDHLDGKCIPDRVDDLTRQRLRQLRAPYAGERFLFTPPPPVVIKAEDFTPEQEAAEEKQLVEDIVDAALPRV
jgi:peptide deformylase